jgi:hypothetical protein
VNVLVDPKPEEGSPGLREHGRIDDKAYYSYSMNLDTDDLPAEEKALLDAIRPLLK